MSTTDRACAKVAEPSSQPSFLDGAENHGYQYQHCFSYNWNAMRDPKPAERIGMARTVNPRCQSGLWEGSSADSSSRFLTNAKDGLKKSLRACRARRIARHTGCPSPYCNSEWILLLHVFTCQNRRSAQSASPVNSYDSRSSESSDCTSMREMACKR